MDPFFVGRILVAKTASGWVGDFASPQNTGHMAIRARLFLPNVELRQFDAFHAPGSDVFGSTSTISIKPTYYISPLTVKRFPGRKNISVYRAACVKFETYTSILLKPPLYGLMN